MKLRFWRINTTVAISLLSVLATSLLGGCSGGGRVDLVSHPIVSSASSASSQPSLSLSEAVGLVLNAESTTAQDDAVSRIRSYAAPAFPWNQFWQALQEGQMKSHWPSPQLRSLLSLSQIQCQSTHFSSFAEFVASRGYDEGFPLLSSSQTRQCSLPLSPNLTRRLLALMSARLSQRIAGVASSGSTHITTVSDTQNQLPDPEIETATSASRLFVEQVSLSPDAGWTETSDSLHAQQWAHVVDTLLRAEQGMLLIRLVHAHIQVNHEAPFVSRIATQLIRGATQETSDIFPFALQVLGVEGISRIVSDIPQSQLGGTDTASQSNVCRLIPAFLERLQSEFNPNLVRSDSDDGRWLNSWRELLALRQLEDHVRTCMTRSQSLNWLEKLHRKLERDFLDHPENAARFLSNLPNTTFDARWIKLRLYSKLSLSFPLVDLRTSEHPASPLDIIIQARIDAHLLSSQENEGREAIRRYCTLLELPEDVTDVATIQQNSSRALTRLLLPGCHAIRGIQGPLPANFDLNQHLQRGEKKQLHFSAARIIMPYDSVWIAPGIDISVDRSGTFDGSIIDLSADQTYLRPEATPTPPEYDSQTVPLLMGIQMNSATDNFERGIHYFIYHHVLRQARQGPPPLRIPERGYPAGSIRFELTQLQDSHQPTVRAFGGIGQESAPASRGGQSAQSSLNATEAATLISQELPLRPENRGVNQTPNYLSSPRLEQIEELWREGVRESTNTNTLLVFVDPVYVARTISEETRLFISRVCTEQTHQSSIVECLRTWGRSAGHAIADMLPGFSSLTQEQRFRTPDQMRPRWSPPAGAPGITYPQGATGEIGHIYPNDWNRRQ